MTTEQLERELRKLAEPRVTDERLRRATRARLDERLLVLPRRRSRNKLELTFGGAAVAAAVAAVALLALGGPGGSAGPPAAEAAIIHHALHAISLPPNTIVHVKEVGVANGTRVEAEWWQQTDAPYALRMIKGPVGRALEGAADGTTSFQYNAGTNTIVETPNARTPTLVDPIAGVRRQLADGGAQVSGKATINGVSLYRIELSTGVIAYFDTVTFRPMYLDNPQGSGNVVRTRVVSYDELPANAANAKLLSITAQHPDARVETRAAPSK
jgi:hypothetical protein